MLAMFLSGCSWSGSFGPPAYSSAPAAAGPVPARIVVENGAVVQEPLTPIESTIEALSQAQTTRTLVRQLARP